MATSKGDRFGTFLIALGSVLICICIVLVAHNARENLDAQSAVIEQLPAIHQVIEERKAAEHDTSTPYIPMAATDEEVTPEMTSVEIDGYGYIGYLYFPSLDMELPVMDQCDSKRLRRAPCWYSGSYYTNDLVIAAHNYRSSFGKLKNIIQGDLVFFTDMDGNLRGYTVEDIELLEPEDVEQMKKSEFDLSLYTCTYDGSQRLTVRCSEIK